MVIVSASLMCMEEFMIVRLVSLSLHPEFVGARMDKYFSLLLPVIEIRKYN